MNLVPRQTAELPDEIEELLIVSDIHGYRQALQGFDTAISSRKTRYQILFCGDLYTPGPFPGACTSWVMQHAGHLAVRGNHDDEMVNAQITSNPEPLWTEAAAKQKLTPEQFSYMAQLPLRLEVIWRDKRIVLMHGHIRPDGRPGSFITTPQKQMEWFYDEQADFCALGHSHFPYVGRCRGKLMANCGTLSTIMLGILSADGLHTQSGQVSIEPEADTRCSFLSVTLNQGDLVAEISRFPVDQGAMLEDLFAVQCPHTHLIQRCMDDGIAELRTGD